MKNQITYLIKMENSRYKRKCFINNFTTLGLAMIFTVICLLVIIFIR